MAESTPRSSGDATLEKAKSIVAALVVAAAQYPESREDFPWGTRVAKVSKKVFAFFGRDDSAQPSVSVKLPDSVEHALSLACAEPTSHGLGKSGWVTIDLDHPDCPDLELLLDWIDESYRAVAPARLVAHLGQQSAYPGPGATGAT
jgi:predicted DNA-binding protein (MmcQ/YjbR family)